MRLNTKKLIAGFLAFSILFITTFTNFEVKASQQVTFRERITEGAFILNEPIATKNTLPGRADVDLDWENYMFDVKGDTVGSKFLTVRRPVYYDASGTNITSYGKWDIRGNYGATVKVLSIYPNRTESAGLKKWMDNQSSKNASVDIQVTSQSQNDFNANPYKYLKKDANGMYNYDVIVFGFWDEHNNASLSSNSAKIIQNYINSGYGVIFGHDVVQNTSVNRGFNSLVQNNLDILLTPVNRSMWYASDKISVTKQGSLTTYPFDINGMDLTIPRTHTLGQFPANHLTGVPNDDIVYMSLEANYYPSEGDGPYFQYYFLTSAKGPETRVTYKHGNNPEYEYIANGYLLKQDNVAFIQAGHKSGETSNAEQMVIANLIYSLAQISGETGGKDQVLDDIRPSKPVDSNGDLIFESTDYGVGYEYRIVAMPIGYDSSNLDREKISEALSKNVDRYNDNILFSNSFLSSNVISNLKGSSGYQLEKDQDTFRYYIDKNKNGTRTPPVEIPGNENLTDDFYSLRYDEPFDYTKHFSSVSKIADDDYLHVVSYDRANNASEVGNFRIKDILPKADVTINYIYDGNIIKTETKLGADNKNLLIGSSFSSIPEKNINVDDVKYVYSHSEPKTSITLSDDNVINHIYDKLVTKDVYIVEVRPEINGEEYTKTKTLYLTETVEVGTNIIVKNNTPDLTEQNLKYVGWSQGTEGDYGNYLTDEEFVWTDDEDNIYLYYEKKVGNVKIEIVREDGKEFEPGVTSYNYSKDGFIGEVLTITGSDIKSEIDVHNSIAFSNRGELQNYYKEFLLEDVNGNYSDTIVLKPRTIKIFGLGIDYMETTSPSAISTKTNNEDKAVYVKKEIFSVTRTYDQDLQVEEKAPATIVDSDDSSTWKNFYDEVNGQDVTIDFSNNRDINIGYYKGVKPTEAYTVTANFLNIIDYNSNNIIEPYSSGTLNVVNSPNIPVKDTIAVPNIVDGRNVDFELEHYEVIFNDISKIYDNTINLNDVIPYTTEAGEAKIGDYKVNVYYRPYARVIYTEKVFDATGTAILSSKTTKYDVPYDTNEKSLKPSQPTSQYNIEVSEKGNYDEINEKICTKISDYQYEVTTKYVPKVYNLEIEVLGKIDESGNNKVIDNAVRKSQTIYLFKNIPIKNKVEFPIPNYENSNYYFQDVELVYDKDLGGTVSVSDDEERIVFTPDSTKDIDKKTYKLNMNYRLLAEVLGNVTIHKFNEKPNVKQVSKEAFLGDSIKVEIPETEGFILTNAYLDGEEYTNIETGVFYKLLIEKPLHYIELVYRELKYNLQTEAKTSGGTIDGEGNFYKGENVYIKVWPETGYKLERLVVDGADIQLQEEDGTIGYYYFDMPNVNFSIYAYFVRDNDEIDTGTGIELPSQPDDDDDEDDNNSGKDTGTDSQPDEKEKEEVPEEKEEEKEKEDEKEEEKEDVELPSEDDTKKEEDTTTEKPSVTENDDTSQPEYTVIKGEDNIYYVYDENGIALGTISEEDYMLGNFDNIIPFGTGNIPKKEEKLAETTKKENPKTGANNSISFGITGLIMLIFVSTVIKIGKEKIIK